MEDVDYDTDGAGGQAASGVADFVYDNAGRETSRTFGNSLVTTMSHITGENLIDTLTNSTVGNYSYSWDANKNKTAETITGVMSGYGFTTPSGYDDEDRLTVWERDDTNLDLAWTLSDVGDWDSYTVNTSTENRTHNDIHELTAINATSLTYDAKGNLTQDDAGIDYTWDMDNMLQEADVPASPARGIEGTHTYTYDALGRRVSKMVDDAQAMTTETTVFVCLTQPIPFCPWAGQVLAEYTSGTSASSPLRKYAYGEYIDEPLVMMDRTAAGSTGAGSDEEFYYHNNEQYSVVALSESGGSITERYRYTPYGEVTILAPNATTVRILSDLANAFTYTGRRLDSESDLHYFRRRYVLSPTGRFLNRDPLTYINGTSLYCAYFASNGNDPSGLHKGKHEMLHGGGGGGIGGYWGPVRPLTPGFPRWNPPSRSFPRRMAPPEPGRGGRPTPGGNPNPGGRPTPNPRPTPVGDHVPSPGGAPVPDPQPNPDPVPKPEPMCGPTKEVCVGRWEGCNKSNDNQFKQCKEDAGGDPVKINDCVDDAQGRFDLCRAMWKVCLKRAGLPYEEPPLWNPPED